MKKKIENLIPLTRQNHKTEVLNILSDCSVEELKTIALDLYPEVEWLEEYADTPKYKLLKLVLKSRKQKLDAKFVCTPRVLEKLCWLDEQIMDLQEMLYQEVIQKISKMNQEKESGKKFLRDSDEVMESDLIPYIFTSYIKQDVSLDDFDDDYTDFDETDDIHKIDDMDKILIDMIPRYLLRFYGKSNEELRDNKCFKEKLNWNKCKMPSQINSADFYISWNMQELCCHSPFSLSDILRINFLWGEVKAGQKQFVTISKPIKLL